MCSITAASYLPDSARERRPVLVLSKEHPSGLNRRRCLDPPVPVFCFACCCGGVRKQVFWTFFSVIGGGFYFEEFHTLHVLAGLGFAVGVLVVSVSVMTQQRVV